MAGMTGVAGRYAMAGNSGPCLHVFQNISNFAVIDDNNMKLFPRKKMKELADKGSLLKSNLIVALCVILIAVNVGVFIFIPKILAPLALILSNAITIICMVLAFQPMNYIMKTIIAKKEDEIYQRKKEEEALKEKVTALENKTRELSSCLNTWGQIASAPMEMNYIREYVIARPTFDEYIVKEVPLAELLEDPHFKPRDPEGFREKWDKLKDNLFHSKDKTVLYIGKHRAKRSIGIDLDKVRFAADGNRIALYGANITVLSDEKTPESTEDVSHCWVLNNDKKGDNLPPVISINTADQYSDIPRLYSERCTEEVQSGFDRQYQLLCQQKTKALQELLSEHVPGVVFYDSIDATSAPWLSLKDNIKDTKLYPVISSIKLICDIISD